MDLNQFGINIIENLIASFPQFVVVLSTVLYSLNNIKKTTTNFPEQIKETKLRLQEDFEIAKEGIQNSFDEAKEALIVSFKEAKEDINVIVKDVTKQIYDNVNVAMESMKDELSTYKKELINAKNQTNMVVREAKAFMDIISNLVSKDPKAIRDGVATSIQQRLNMTKEELEQYPSLIMTEVDVLQQSMKDAILLLGEEKFKELLEKIGYEQKTEEA